VSAQFTRARQALAEAQEAKAHAATTMVVARQRIIVIEALLSRGFWGRLKWLLLGK
jgi:thiamine phosphate synthase YjbQ (UPF0047 family)